MTLQLYIIVIISLVFSSLQGLDDNLQFNDTGKPTILNPFSFTNTPSVSPILSAAAGDINGDGYDDFIFGFSTYPSSLEGSVHLVFGNSDISPIQNFDPSFPNPNVSISLFGYSQSNGFARSISGQGDVNGDGFDDILIGANSASIIGGDLRGAVYLVFGGPHPNFWPTSVVSIETLNSSFSIRIDGFEDFEQIGTDVSIIQDINNDGFDDILLSNQNNAALPTVFLIFGKSNWTSPWSLSSLDGVNGVKITSTFGTSFGNSFLSVGDVNNDGFGDFLISSHNEDSPQMQSGAVYLFFGHNSSWIHPFGVTTQFNSSHGVKFQGGAMSVQAGTSINAAGDFNNDGFNDFLIGSPLATYSQVFDGKVFLIFGHSGPWTYPFDLSTDINSTSGLTFAGTSLQERLGQSSCHGSFGDFNGDNYTDIVIGSMTSDVKFLVFGNSSTTDNTIFVAAPGSGLFKIVEISDPEPSSIGSICSSVGDVNGDGLEDLVFANDVLDIFHFGYLLPGQHYCSPGYALDSFSNYSCSPCPVQLGYQYNPVDSSQQFCVNSTFNCGPGTNYSFVAVQNQITCLDCPPTDPNLFVFNPLSQNAPNCTSHLIGQCSPHQYLIQIPNTEETTDDSFGCKFCLSSNPDINPLNNTLKSCQCGPGTVSGNNGACVFNPDDFTASLAPLIILPILFIVLLSMRLPFVLTYCGDGISGLKSKPETAVSFHQEKPVWSFDSFSTVFSNLEQSNSATPSQLLDSAFASIYLLFAHPTYRNRLVTSIDFNIAQTASIFSHFSKTPLIPFSPTHFDLGSKMIIFGILLELLQVLALIFQIGVPAPNIGFQQFLDIFLFKFVFQEDSAGATQISVAFWIAFVISSLTIALSFINRKKGKTNTLPSALAFLFSLPVFYSLFSVWHCTSFSFGTFVTSSLQSNQAIYYSQGLECYTPYHISLLVLSALILIPFTFLSFTLLSQLSSRYISCDKTSLAAKRTLLFLCIFCLSLFPTTKFFTPTVSIVLNLAMFWISILGIILISKKRNLFPDSFFFNIFSSFIHVLWIVVLFSRTIASLINDSTSIGSSIVLLVSLVLLLFFGLSYIISEYDSSIFLLLGVASVEHNDPQNDDSSASMTSSSKPLGILTLITIFSLVTASSSLGGMLYPDLFQLSEPPAGKHVIDFYPSVSPFFNSFSSAGDVNNDGYADFLISDAQYDSNSGRTVLFFGGPGFFESLSLIYEPLDQLPSNIKAIEFLGEGNILSGTSTSGVGDVNDDGYDDFLIGAQNAHGQYSNNEGAVFLIFGRGDIDWSTTTLLSSLNGTTSGGILIGGNSSPSLFGQYVHGAGDVNGDGVGDFLISAPEADSNGMKSGSIILFFGHNGSWPHPFYISSIDGANGVAFNGEFPWTKLGLGSGISSAGDVNIDGYSDFLLGCPEYPVNGRVYLIFGRQTWTPSVDISTLNGTDGVIISGPSGPSGAKLGRSLSGARGSDFNQDGVDDFIVTAYDSSDPYSVFNAGQAHVIFGHSGPWNASLDLTALNTSTGIAFNSDISPSWCGRSASLTAGDFNADGISDLLLGCTGISPGHLSQSGIVVVMLGRDSWSASYNMSLTIGNELGMVISGSIDLERLGNQVSSLGDINGDGFDEMMFQNENFAYILYGSPICGHGYYHDPTDGWKGCTPCGESSLFGSFNPNGTNLGACSWAPLGQCSSGSFVSKTTYTSSCVPCPSDPALIGYPGVDYSDYSLQHPFNHEPNNSPECTMIPTTLCVSREYLKLVFVNGTHSIYECQQCPLSGQNPSPSLNLKCICPKGTTEDDALGICALSVSSTVGPLSYIWLGGSTLGLCCLLAYRFRVSGTSNTVSDLEMQPLGELPSKPLSDFSKYEQFTPTLSDLQESITELTPHFLLGDSQPQFSPKFVESLFAVATRSVHLLNAATTTSPVDSQLLPQQEAEKVYLWVIKSSCAESSNFTLSGADIFIFVQQFINFFQYLGFLFTPPLLWALDTGDFFRFFLFDFNLGGSWVLVYWFSVVLIWFWFLFYLSWKNNWTDKLVAKKPNSNIVKSFVEFLHLEHTVMPLFVTALAVPLFLTQLKVFQCASFQFPGKFDDFIVSSVDVNSSDGYSYGVVCYSLEHVIMIIVSIISLSLFVVSAFRYRPIVQYRGRTQILFKDLYLELSLAIKFLLACLTILFGANISSDDPESSLVVLFYLLALTFVFLGPFTFYTWKTKPCITFPSLNHLITRLLFLTCYFAIASIVTFFIDDSNNPISGILRISGYLCVFIVFIFFVKSIKSLGSSDGADSQGDISGVE